jgi:hypothetical protein
MFITATGQANNRSRQAGVDNQSRDKELGQRAVRHGFNSGHMKGGLYTKGMGQQKTNSRGTNNFRDGKWANKPWGEFARFHP